ASPPVVPSMPAPASPTVAPAVLAEPDPACDIAIQTTVTSMGGGRFELVATATNETDQPIEATIRARCPGPVARFDGLPGEYDYGGTCRMGACIEPVTQV